jgi:hypothetical protein
MAERKALFVLNDAWYPGWIAFVDGIAQPIFRTNFHFRGVFLEPGEHELHFVFAPQRFRIGLWIACSTAVFIGALSGLLHCLPKTLPEEISASRFRPRVSPKILPRRSSSPAS